MVNTQHVLKFTINCSRVVYMRPSFPDRSIFRKTVHFSLYFTTNLMLQPVNLCSVFCFFRVDHNPVSSSPTAAFYYTSVKLYPQVCRTNHQFTYTHDLRLSKPCTCQSFKYSPGSRHFAMCFTCRHASNPLDFNTKFHLNGLVLYIAR